MTVEQDQANFIKLIQQVKEAKVADNLEIGSDAEITIELKEKLLEKDGRYFLRAFGIDDEDVDNEEFELVQWILFDLYQVKNESEYRQRIKALSS